MSNGAQSTTCAGLGVVPEKPHSGRTVGSVRGEVSSAAVLFDSPPTRRAMPSDLVEAKALLRREGNHLWHWWYLRT